MNEPWGISGPDFLKVYFVAFAFALLFALAMRILARAGGGDAHPPRHDQLTLDELAYLAGGAQRVVETAVARLVDAGKLRPSRSGSVQAVHGATANYPIDRAVLADAQRYGHRTLTLLVDRVGQDAAVRGIGAGLAGKGLLVDKGTARARLSAVPVAVLFVVGVARWANGLSEGRSIGWLTLALVVTAVVGIALYRRPVAARTFTGDRVFRQARRGRGSLPGPSTNGADYALLGGGAAMMVVFGGLAAHPDVELAAMEAHRASAAGSSSSSSSCGGSSSSCSSGGGSSCGGGGGGCGG
ncbi:TIGR04222 domain-containing membrane protein [Actinokineospora sp.]|uniref:TIGR04222 domain-containing membrane protein n=1 Tax=Actinokineospora sp. TaxID=1872133 RepID=UPI004037AA93